MQYEHLVSANKATTSPIRLHWHQLRRAGHVFALLTASPLTSLGRGRGGRSCTLGRWSTRLELNWTELNWLI